MSALRIIGGPLDGGTHDLSPARPGDTFEAEGARYRVEDDGAGRLYAVWVPSTGLTMRRGEIVTRAARPGERLNLTEAAAALMVGGTVGVGFGLSLVLLTLLGSWLHDLAGSYFSLLLWSAAVGAVLILVGAMVTPSTMRDDRP